MDQDAIDDAFIGTFKGLAHRMFRIFKNDFVFELVSEMAQLVEEEHGKEGQHEHVCDDCKEIHGSEPVKSKSVNKGNLH